MNASLQSSNFRGSSLSTPFVMAVDDSCQYAGQRQAAIREVAAKVGKSRIS